MYLAALPLLAAELTPDPLAVSVVTFAGWLPWLLFTLPPARWSTAWTGAGSCGPSTPPGRWSSVA